MQISIWEKESFYASADILIIGAGLAGLWSAYHLKKQHPDASILILEQGIIPNGASTRNAGFACFGSVTELIKDAATMGEDSMWQTVEMRYKGIEKIRQVFTDDEIDYMACGGYECIDYRLHNIDTLKDQVQWINQGLQKITGIEETFNWSNEKLRNFDLHGFDALLENRLEGALHSGKLVQALTKKVQSMGVRILTGLEVSGLQENQNCVEVATKEIAFTASQLIVCTNAFSGQLFPKSPVQPGRGQILVTSPIKNLRLCGTFHYDEGFYYFRNLGNRILLGGARHHAIKEETTLEFNTTGPIQQELKRFLKEHLLKNSFYSIDYSWSGIMGFTVDKQPMIARHSSRISSVMICNGMGVALAPIITEKLSF